MTYDPRRLEEVCQLVEQLFANLDTLPYHTILGVPRNAHPDQIRGAFYLRAELLHPDRFYNLEDGKLKDKVYEVYKRVAEAYRVLENPETRQLYEEGLKRKQFRLVLKDREGLVKAPDEGITNLQAKRFFRLGLDCLRGGDLKSAKLNFGLAASMEPKNAVIEEQQREVERQAGEKK
jgi:curved DNA-binding protein CbpA